MGISTRFLENLSNKGEFASSAEVLERLKPTLEILLRSILALSR
jgi:hypothetical protein